MTNIEKRMYLVLLLIDAAAIIVGMVAGPLGEEVISISASVAAVIISLGLIVYGIYFWRRKER